MKLWNTNKQYGSLAKWFHWIIFILLTGMLVYGFLLDWVPESYKALGFNLHKLIGLTILFLMVLRFSWYLINPKPALPNNTPHWQRLAARLVHFLLYFFAITMPLAGWIGSSAGGKFPHIGDFMLKFPVPEDKGLKEIAFNIHEIVAYVLIALISIHVLATLYHYFIKRDNVLQRML